jgi:hypothetical protein
MGDGADDAQDAEERHNWTIAMMTRAGCRPCPHLPHEGGEECPVCHDLNWLDADGKPCEP